MSQVSGGLFDLTEIDLLKKAQRDISDYWDSQDLSALFNALCTLNHLREWICPNSKIRMSARDWPATPEEVLFQNLWDNEHVQVVRQLCDRSKHFKTRGADAAHGVVEGFNVGLSGAGDRLDQTYHVVDGEDVRVPLAGVLREYLAFFDARRPGWSERPR
jgi:hypothetical protein